jgi:hypothetical protein
MVPGISLQPPMMTSLLAVNCYNASDIVRVLPQLISSLSWATFVVSWSFSCSFSLLSSLLMDFSYSVKSSPSANWVWVVSSLVLSSLVFPSYSLNVTWVCFYFSSLILCRPPSSANILAIDPNRNILFYKKDIDSSTFLHLFPIELKQAYCWAFALFKLSYTQFYSP